MRKAVLLSASLLTLWAGAVHASGDFSDYDDDLMRTLDKTIKYFEPDISAKNARGIAEDAEILMEGFKYSEEYFAKKGRAEDAVRISQQGQLHVAAAVKFVKENNYDAAVSAARDAARTCRSCHDVYKTKT